MSGDSHKTVIKGNTSKYVKLNVGGSLHYTTIGTLVKHDTMLRAMFSGRMEVLTDSEGWILIDRCGKHFGSILTSCGMEHCRYLKTDESCLSYSKKPSTTWSRTFVACEYELAALILPHHDPPVCIGDEEIEQALKVREELEPICKVPLITSSREEQQLIASTSKVRETVPVVKLICNRHNNKYSYTSNSDDNLLKNIELLDKLSLRFHGRVMFIKDVISSNEICCWSFYGHGAKIAEVCCTSIVYGTDKKHTKVEFPEARIFEETLNVLLYEHRGKGPDAELMQRTRGARDGAQGYNSDEDVEEKLDRAMRRK
ncbi:hypothetical protein BaRGS_00020800 [Batillaria attramentaria]|uniref:Potassium channel tetramerisation-type BTB domain-containing protein n=1 Tax=Batillaria attramentaria TaxID=370345 RepID=A0ABD0KLB3_9CAEN